MTILALYHIKGGVGKTAAAANLGYLAAEDGKNTLLCDLDPQAALTFTFRIKAKLRRPRKSMLRGGQNLRDNIKGTDFPRLDLLPADFALRRLDLAFNQTNKPRTRLKKTLSELTDEYDWIVLDCPPNLTLASENVFRAADVILVPVIPTTLSVRTYVQLCRFFQRENPKRESPWPFFSMVERRKNMHRETMTAFKNDNPKCFDAAIPYRSDVEKMGLFRKPIFLFAPRSPAATAFRNLYREILDRLG